MTDRINSFIVTLDSDMRDDDAESILNAIRCIRRVIDVSPVVSEHSDHIAHIRVRRELLDKVWDLIKDGK